MRRIQVWTKSRVASTLDSQSLDTDQLPGVVKSLRIYVGTAMLANGLDAAQAPEAAGLPGAGLERLRKGMSNSRPD